MEQKRSIAAGMVLYNPENIARVRAAIDSVLCQADRLYIFDNSTEQQPLELPEQVTYFSGNGNKGIAHALNRLMQAARADGYEWIITMDQDSVLPPETVSLYSRYLNKSDRIAVICPQVIDTRRSYLQVKTEPKAEFVDFCITSASCTNLTIWEKIGKFDEWLFVDLVDNEYCKRLTAAGYRILRLNTLVLDQEFGKIIPKSQRIQKFWNTIAKLFGNDNFAKFGYHKFVNPLRVYYTHRNLIYVNRKMKFYGKVGFENYNCKGYPGFLIAFTLPSILRAQDKRLVLRAALKGMYDGFRSKPAAWKW